MSEYVKQNIIPLRALSSFVGLLTIKKAKKLVSNRMIATTEKWDGIITSVVILKISEAAKSTMGI